MVPRPRLQEATHECDDEGYHEYLSHVTNAQIKRLNVEPLDRQDAFQDCFAHFWGRDLRKSYNAQRGTKFNTYITTCIYRYVLRWKLAACKPIDPIRYQKRKDNQAGETDALLAIERLRAVFGDRLVDTMIAQADSRTPETMRRGAYTTLLKEMRDCHDKEAGAE